jgi:hypothetical protein
VTYASSITNPAGQDLVVFTSVPYDAFEYEVVASPEADEVGETFTLNLPRPARVHHLERSYYNAHNGDGPDVTDDVVTHTIGSPWSYPSAAERDDMIAGSEFLLMSPPTDMGTCSAGGAIESRYVEWNDTGYAGGALEVGVGVEFENVASGFLFGADFEYHFRVELIWEWSNATFIQGDVGDMILEPNEEWDPALAFDWGIFAYRETLPGNSAPFTVVEYWVE